MASIINAATSGGLITTADTSGILNIQTASTTAVTIDGSQNVGIGVTPNANWSTAFKALDIGFTGNSLVGFSASDVGILSGCYYQGGGSSGWKWSTTNSLGASYYEQYNGASIWHISAPTAHTAGTPVTFTQAMTLGADGNMILGGTSPTTSGGYTSLSINNATNSGYLVLQSNGTNKSDWYVSGGTVATLRGVAVPLVLAATGANYLSFENNSTERARIDSSGNFGIGTTSPARRLESRSTGGVQLRAAYDTLNYIDIGHMSSTTGGVINSVGDATVNRFLSIQLDGSQVMRILSTGYVGINTSSPGTNGAFEIRKAVTTGAMTNCSFSTSDAANSTFDIGHPGANIVALSAQGSHLAFYGGGDLGNAERMRIDKAHGALLVGTTSPAARLTVVNDSQSLDWALSLKTVQDAPGTNNYYLVDFRTSAGFQTGYIWSNGGTTTAYVSPSDYRLKNSITPMTGALAKVAQLRPVTYKWNVNNSDGQGFIAHELQTVIPDCVSGEKDGLDKEGNPRYQGVDSSFLVATLTAAIQEQQALITQLQADVAALKGA